MFRNSWKYYSPPYVGICCYLSLHLYHGRRSDLFSAQNKTKSNAYIQVGIYRRKKASIVCCMEYIIYCFRCCLLQHNGTRKPPFLIRLHVCECVCVWCLLYTLVRRPWPSFTIRGLFTSAPFVGVFNHAPIITAKHW